MAEEKKDTRTPLERFHHGVPLSPELKALKDGIEGPTPPVKVALMPPPPIADAMRALTNAEKADLRDLRAHPGWRVLERLKEKSLQSTEKSAIAKSQIDPLGNANEVLNDWAYLTMLRQGHKALEAMIEFEIKVDVKA